MQSITWSYDPNKLTLSGNNPATITAKQTIVPSSTTNISAVANYIGGCTVPSNNKTFVLYTSQTPPVPTGYFDVYPSSPDPDCICNGSCDWQVDFTQTNSYDNGVFYFQPDVVIFKFKGIKILKACYKNLCSNALTCKTESWFFADPDIYCNNNSNYKTNNYNTNSGIYQYLEQKNIKGELKWCLKQEYLKEFNDILIYPNPVNDVVYITVPNLEHAKYSIKDMKGVVLQKGEIEAESQGEINMDKLNSGVYIIEVKTEQKNYSKQIIKR